MEKIIIIIVSIILELLLIYAIKRKKDAARGTDGEEIAGDNTSMEENKTEVIEAAGNEEKEGTEDKLLIEELEDEMKNENILENEDVEKIGKDDETELLAELGRIEEGTIEKDPISEFGTDEKVEDILGELEDLASKLRKNKA